MRQQAVGDWLEDLEHAKTRAGVALATTGPGRVQRRLELRADRTFTLSLVDDDGNQFEPPVTMGGRWRIRDATLDLLPGDSAFAAPHAGATLDVCLQFSLTTQRSNADFLEFRDRTGQRVRFARTP